MLKGAQTAQRRPTYRPAIAAQYRSRTVPARICLPLPLRRNVASVARKTPPPPPLRHVSTTKTPIAEEGQNQKDVADTDLIEFLHFLGRDPNRASLKDDLQKHPNLVRIFSQSKALLRLAEACASSHDPNKAIVVLDLAHSLHPPLQQNMYECTCHQLSLSRCWHLISIVFLRGQMHTGKTTIRLLNWYARALLETEDFATLHTLLGLAMQYGVTPNRRTFHLLIAGAIRNHDLPAVQTYLHKMRAANIPIDESTHSLIPLNYRSFGMSPEVQDKTLKTLPSVPEATAASLLNVMIQARLEGDDVIGATILLDLFSSPHIQPIKAALLRSGCIHEEDGSDEGKQTASAFRAQTSISPTSKTYSLFIHFLASRSNLENIHTLLQNMTSLDIFATTSTVTALIHAYDIAGEQNSAIRMLAALCDPIHSSRELFDPLCLPQQRTLAPPPEVANVKPNIRVFNAVFRMILRSSGTERVTHLLRIMQANEVRPNNATLQIFITHLSRVERFPPQALVKVVRALIAPQLLTSSSVHLSPRLIHTLVSASMRRERYLLYGFGWTKKGRDCIHPTVEDRQLSSLASPVSDAFMGINIPGSSSTRSTFSTLRTILRERNVRPDSAMFSIRIRRDGIRLGGAAAEDLLQTFIRRGFSPNAYHICALMEAYARRGNVYAATRVMNAAHRIGIQPNVVMFTVLISVHARKGRPKKATRVFGDMLRAGITPDVAAIDALVSSYFVAGEMHRAKQTLRALWPYVQNPAPADLHMLSLKKLRRVFRRLGSDSKPGIPSSVRREIWARVNAIAQSLLRGSIREKYRRSSAGTVF